MSQAPVTRFRLPPEALYSEWLEAAGRTVWTRTVDIERDLDTIHHWMNQDFVEAFWAMAWPKESIRDYLRWAEVRPHFDTFLGFVEDEPIGYFEIYDPHHDKVGEKYDVQPADIGMHLLIGNERYLRQFTVRLGVGLLRYVFQTNPNADRVIGEPDIRNRKILNLMKFLGYRQKAVIAMPDKTAALVMCRREDFERLHGPVDRETPITPTP